MQPRSIGYLATFSGLMVLCHFGWTVVASDVSEYVWSCDLQLGQRVPLHRSDVSDVSDVHDSINDAWKVRLLDDDGFEAEAAVGTRYLRHYSVGSSSSSRRSLDNNEDTVWTRQCSCSASIVHNATTVAKFCELRHSHCGVPKNDDNDSIVCFSPPNNLEKVSRVLWVMAVISFGLIIWGLSFTAHGRHAINYVRTHHFSDRTERIVHDLMQSSPYLANWYIERYLNRNPEQRMAMAEAILELRRDTPLRTVTVQKRLLLRTTTYMKDETRSATRTAESTISGTTTDNSLKGFSDNEEVILSSIGSDDGNTDEDSSNDTKEEAVTTTAETATETTTITMLNGIDDDSVIVNDDDDHHECTICFCMLEHGDRIGAFKCNHTFHVDCLKDWLVRRNCCPLCLRKNVASLQTVTTVHVFLPATDNTSGDAAEGQNNDDDGHVVDMVEEQDGSRPASTVDASEEQNEDETAPTANTSEQQNEDGPTSAPVPTQRNMEEV